jgi:antitoxin ParD1/3/4
MPTCNVVLTDHQATFVEQMVSSGRYQNVSEVLRLIERREQHDAGRLKLLRQAAKVGMADIAAGRFKTFATSEALGLELRSVVDRVIAST